MRIAPITIVVPRSGCLRISTAGIATASSGSHSSWMRRNVLRDSSAAIAIASTTLAGSDGWNWNGPIWIQRAAPSTECPLKVMNTSSASVTTYSGSAQRRQMR